MTDNNNEEKEAMIGMDENITVPVPVTSFADLDAMNEAKNMVAGMKATTMQFAEMAENIFMNEEVEDKAAALQNLATEFAERINEPVEKSQPLTDKAVNIYRNLVKATTKMDGGVDYPASDYAYVPDPEKPSTWKLRMSQGRPGNITVSQLGRAAAAFSEGGFRGQRVEIPAQDVAGVKAKIRAEYRKLDVPRKDMPDSIKEQFFTIWHDKEKGQYRWFAMYSNKFRDNDNPPEIISDESHRNFVKGVEENRYPYPELWLWHVKDSRVGVSDWLAYTDEGFALASGYFENDAVAKGLMEYEGELKTSHGMPKPFIKRDEADETIIVEHVTREISPLPARIAANKLTNFELLSKEEEMTIPVEKKEFLKQVGLTDDQINQIESGVEKAASQANDEGLEFKEEATEEVEVEFDMTEMVKAMQTMIEPLVKEIKTLKDEVAELKQTDEEKIKEIVGNTSKSSLQALAAKSVEGLFSSANEVDGRTSIAKNGPTQNKSNEEGRVFFQDWLTPAEEDVNV